MFIIRKFGRISGQEAEKCTDEISCANTVLESQETLLGDLSEPDLLEPLIDLRKPNIRSQECCDLKKLVLESRESSD